MIMISVFYTCRKIACVSAQLMLFCSFVEPTQNKVYLILSYLTTCVYTKRRSVGNIWVDSVTSVFGVTHICVARICAPYTRATVSTIGHLILIVTAYAGHRRPGRVYHILAFLWALETSPANFSTCPFVNKKLFNKLLATYVTVDDGHWRKHACYARYFQSRFFNCTRETAVSVIRLWHECWPRRWSSWSRKRTFETHDKHYNKFYLLANFLNFSRGRFGELRR